MCSELKQTTLSCPGLCGRLALCQPILHFAKLTTSPRIRLRWKAEFDTGLFWPPSCTVNALGFCNLYTANFVSQRDSPSFSPGLLCVSGVFCHSYQRIVSFAIFFSKSKFFEVLGTLPTARGMCLRRVTIDEAAWPKVTWERKVYLAYISWVRPLEKVLLNQPFHLFGREFRAHAEKPSKPTLSHWFTSPVLRNVKNSTLSDITYHSTAGGKVLCEDLGFYLDTNSSNSFTV